MARIEWDKVGERYFSAGIDRGVLYIDGKAVPWNGLISVQESSTGGEVVPVYLDGIRIRNISTLSEYQATITAFYSPPEFDQCDGIYASQYTGFYATNQSRKPFALSYRNKFTNDAGVDGYKIHLIYNAMAEPASPLYQTLSDDSQASSLTWDIKAVPNFEMTEYISAHYIFDTTKVPEYVVEAFENTIYGSRGAEPKLPSPYDIERIFVGFWGLTVTDTGKGYYEIEGTALSLRKNASNYTIVGPTVIPLNNHYSIASGDGDA